MKFPLIQLSEILHQFSCTCAVRTKQRFSLGTIVGGSLKNPITLHDELKLIVKRMDNHIDLMHLHEHVSCHV